MRDDLKKWFKERFFVETICPHCMQIYELPRRKLNTNITCANCDNNFVVEKIITCPNCQTICRESETTCSVCDADLDVCKCGQNLTGLKKVLNYDVNSFLLCFWPPALMKAVCENMDNCRQEEEAALGKKSAVLAFRVFDNTFRLRPILFSVLVVRSHI